MQKIEVARKLSEQTSMPVTDCLKSVDNVFGIIADALRNGQNVYVRNFGTFRVVHRKEKKCRNIKACTSVMVPEHYTVKLVLSHKIQINNNGNDR